MTTRSPAREIALLNKLEHLPVMPRRRIHLHRFDLSSYPVLCWYHGVIRRDAITRCCATCRMTAHWPFRFPACVAAGLRVAR